MVHAEWLISVHSTASATVVLSLKHNMYIASVDPLFATWNQQWQGAWPRSRGAGCKWWGNASCSSATFASVKASESPREARKPALTYFRSWPAPGYCKRVLWLPVMVPMSPVMVVPMGAGSVQLRHQYSLPRTKATQKSNTAASKSSKHWSHGCEIV